MNHTPEALDRTRHYLVVAPDVTLNEVTILAAAFHRATRLVPTPHELPGVHPARTRINQQVSGVLVLSRHSALALLPEAPRDMPRTPDTTKDRLGDQWFVLDTLKERDPYPPPTLGDRDGLRRVLGSAWPIREEWRMIQWLVAAARRLHATVVLDVSAPGQLPRYVPITPNPQAAINLTIYTRIWLTPQACELLSQQIAPGARLAPAHEGWDGPVHTAITGTRDLERLSQQAITKIHDAVDDDDLAALSQQPDLRSYAVLLDYSSPASRHTATGQHISSPQLVESSLISIDVGAAEVVPQVLADDEDLRSGCVQFRITWEPSDPIAANQERPPADLVQERAHAARVIAQLATVIYQACGGYIIDEDGFAVDPIHLL